MLAPFKHWTHLFRVGHLTRLAGPRLSAWTFGFRLWASVCRALHGAFWLELDNPFWAGTSAAIVCQPQLGASLRKGWLRMIGTLVGAVMCVVLTACFPQDRALFLGGLALWGPDATTPLQRAELLAALAVGSEIVRLRHTAHRLSLGDHLDPALAALAQGNSANAIAQLARLDATLAVRGGAGPSTQAAL